MGNKNAISLGGRKIVFFDINLECKKDEEMDVVLYVSYSTSNTSPESKLQYIQGYSPYIDEACLNHYLTTYNIIDFNIINPTSVSYIDKVLLFLNLEETLLQQALKEIVQSHIEKQKQIKKAKELKQKKIENCFLKAKETQFLTEIKSL